MVVLYSAEDVNLFSVFSPAVNRADIPPEMERMNPCGQWTSLPLYVIIKLRYNTPLTSICPVNRPGRKKEGNPDKPRRIVAILLAMLMLAGLLPTAALAATSCNDQHTRDKR